MPETIALSPAAVALLRFRIRGRPFPVEDRDRAAFDELVGAGIMEPDPHNEADFRFTDEGWERLLEYRETYATSLQALIDYLLAPAGFWGHSAEDSDDGG